MLTRLAAALFIAAGLMAASPAQAQQQTIPRNPDAELLFEQGVSAFEQGSFNKAYERFRLVNEYSLNRKTTAALLMAGKSLYRLERYRDAVDLLQTLRQRYPESTYADEAQAVIETAREGLRQYGQRPDTLRIGIALPLTDREAPLTQAMFNGVRLAVDKHNGVRRRYVFPPPFEEVPDSVDVYDTAELFGDSLAQAAGRTTLTTPTDTMQVDSLRIVTEQVGRPNWIAKMHFRRTGENGVEAAVDSLIRTDRVDVILGPLYSRDARSAGALAERSRVLLVPPLATDVSVSEGRDYVFQPNPPIPLRGRLMARFASNSLLTDTASVIYERNPSGDIQQLVDGFQAEAERRGIEIPFVMQLNNPRDWSRLPEALSADSTITDSLLGRSKAIYLPMGGRNATGKIQDALTGLGRLPLNAEARVLGNSQWHNLSIEQEASTFRVTYTNDFYVETARPEVQAFIRSYRLLTGTTPDDLSATAMRFAYTGYDVTTFLLRALRPGAGRPGPRALRNAGRFEGLGTRIDFQGGNVNQAMFFHRYRNNRLELLR